jgi:hypothetical protein
MNMGKSKSIKKFLSLGIILVVTLACGFPGLEDTPPPATDPPPPTNTSPPPDSPTNTTESPADTDTPTDTVEPSATTVCDLAGFIVDVTVPDGAKVDPGQNFTKTWRLMNKGSCTWTPDYRLIFSSGDQMGAPAATQFTNGAVAPGAEVDVSVSLTAPNSPGTYKGFFKLRNANNVIFALAGGNPFWVEVKVKSPNPTAVVIPGWPTLKHGNTGDEVTALQYLLNSYGYALAADGIFGVGTRSAVQSFQSSKGLAVDGIVGPNTWNALVSGKTVKSGNSGAAVEAVQYLLVNKFGYGIGVDGIFGPSTTQAVKDFQTTYGLSSDGIVGPGTWKALIAL